MTPLFAIRYVEAQDDIYFVGGIALTALDVDKRLTKLLQASSPKKMRSRAQLDVTIKTLILDGEPVECVEPNTSVLLGLSGEVTALLDAVQELQWRRKSGRFLHTRGDTLLLEDDT